MELRPYQNEAVSAILINGIADLRIHYLFCQQAQVKRSFSSKVVEEEVKDEVRLNPCSSWELLDQDIGQVEVS